MHNVKGFLDAKWDGKSPLLLGLSGGADSKALLYSLLERQVPLHVAHVDHGWRETSAQEALFLQQEIESLHLPFYSIRLSSFPSQNIEANARDQRFLFFHSLFQKIPFQALLLAHHREDVAETVLKRLFEGAHLPFLAGIRSSFIYKGIEIWRPLLSTQKREILQFLEQKKLSFFDDPTNRDPRFLRSRMRMEIFPYLETTFGKNISENLALLAERSTEFEQYLERKLASHPILKAPWGICFDISSLERIEARYLIQKHTSLPRVKLEEVLDRAAQGVKKWQAMPHLLVDRGWILLLTVSAPNR